MEDPKGKIGLLERTLKRYKTAKPPAPGRVSHIAEMEFQILFTQGSSALPRWVAFLFRNVLHSAKYRIPLRVTEYLLYKGSLGSESAYFICPRCDITMEREYQAFCDRCGQRLNWANIEKAKPKKRNTYQL